MQNVDDNTMMIKMARSMPGWVLSIALAVLVVLGITTPMYPVAIGWALSVLAMLLAAGYYRTYNAACSMYNERQLKSLLNELQKEGTLLDEAGLKEYNETEDK